MNKIYEVRAKRWSENEKQCIEYCVGKFEEYCMASLFRDCYNEHYSTDAKIVETYQQSQISLEQLYCRNGMWTDEKEIEICNVNSSKFVKIKMREACEKYGDYNVMWFNEIRINVLEEI